MKNRYIGNFMYMSWLAAVLCVIVCRHCYGGGGGAAESSPPPRTPSTVGIHYSGMDGGGWGIVTKNSS